MRMWRAVLSLREADDLDAPRAVTWEKQMLYRIGNEGGARTLTPLEFMDFGELGKLEKDLEALIAANLLDILFEDAALMPIFQERPIQAEADLYALDRAGDLVIFELKRGYASSDAMLQALRYGQTAGQWTYNQLENKYRLYVGNESISLAVAHQEAFSLERALTPTEFNLRQRFVIIGNALRCPPTARRNRTASRV